MSSTHTGHVRRESVEEPVRMSDLLIVLLGKTGAGKSATGNTILGIKIFKEELSPQTVTRVCKSANTEVNGQQICVIDTIGFSDTRTNTTEFKKKTEQIFDCEDEDIDVFLLIIRLGDRFTQEEQNNVKWIQENFGEKSLKHTLVLFTHADLLHEPVENYLDQHDTLRSVVDQCSGGCHVFNNKSKDQAQVTELLRKIETLRKKNGHKKYTKQDYEKTQKEPQDEKTQKEPQDEKTQKEPQDEKTQKEPQDEKTQKEPQDEKTQKEIKGLSTEAAVAGGVGVVLTAAAAGALYFLKK